MKKISIKETIKRILSIWFISILLASIGYTIFYYFTVNRTVLSSLPYSFSEILWMFTLGSVIFTFPVLPILFLCFRCIYSKTFTPQSRYLCLLALGILNSTVVLVIMYYVRDEYFFSIGLVYSFISITTIITVPYFKGDLK